ncbi:MAG: DNA mismatch repair protein MutT, partial [Alloprevotella tannerae]|nr:DNA mismatch repair protein MutT [Alloprevotella tannerae]
MMKSHPLARFLHCPCCGSPQFEVYDARAKRCAACGFTYYANAACATAAIILNSRGDLLVVRRAFDPA